MRKNRGFATPYFKNVFRQSAASDANVYTFAENGHFLTFLKLSVLLVEATAPSPENAEIVSAIYAPKWSFFILTSLCVLKF